MKLDILKNIQEILLYNLWANTRLIQNLNQIKNDDYIKTLAISFNNLHGLLMHLYYYDAKYYHKIVCDDNAPKLDEPLTQEALFEKILTYSMKWNDWIDCLISNATDIVNIENTSKKIFDLCIHNNYHRGQINNTMSLLGYKPKSLDIFLYRTQQSIQSCTTSYHPSIV